VETEMSNQRTQQRRTWRALSAEEKQQRLAALRHRQQRQIEVELRMLHHVAR
jgi:hypothetical protein